MKTVKINQVVQCAEGRHWQVVWTYDDEFPQRFVAINVDSGVTMSAYTTGPFSNSEPLFTPSNRATIHQRIMALQDAALEGAARSTQAVDDSGLTHPRVAEAVQLMREHIVGGRWRSVVGSVVYLINRAGLGDVPQSGMLGVLGMVEQRCAQLVDEGWSYEFHRQAANVLGFDRETTLEVAIDAVAKSWLFIESLVGGES